MSQCLCHTYVTMYWRNMVFYKMVLQKLDKFKIRCHNTISSADYDYWNTLENYTLLQHNGLVTYHSRSQQQHLSFLNQFLGKPSSEHIQNNLGLITVWTINYDVTSKLVNKTYEVSVDCQKVVYTFKKWLIKLHEISVNGRRFTLTKSSSIDIYHTAKHTLLWIKGNS